MKNIKIILAIQVVLLLVACNSQPNSTEIQKAVIDGYKYNSNYLSGSKIAELFLGSVGIQNMKIDTVEKIECSENIKNSCICEYVIEYTIASNEGSLADLVGANGRKRTTERSRFVKTSKGWIIAEN